MAISGATIWEVRTTGNDNNGGGFVEGATGVDFSQQDSPQATLSAASVVHSTTTQINVAAGDYTVSADDVGNTLQITGGTATAGFYQITAVDIPNNRWTMDSSVGTAGQTVVGNMGGAVASPGKIGIPVVAGNKVFIKAGTYIMSVNSNNVSNGKWDPNTALLVVGYDTDRTFGNNDTRPIIKASTSLNPMWDGTGQWMYNIEFDADNKTNTRCILNGAYTRCIWRNSTLVNSSIVLATDCLAINNAGTGMAGATGSAFVNCESTGNTNGFSGSNATYTNCIAYDNSAHGFITNAASSCHYFGCDAYSNGGDGFVTTDTGGNVSRMLLKNCIIEGNVGTGVNGVVANYPSLVDNCAFFNNGTDTSGPVALVNKITLTSSPFTNAAAGDFSLNNTSGGGAELRGTGTIDVGANTYPQGLTTSHLDVGAAQHLDSGGGGGGQTSHVF